MLKNISSVQNDYYNIVEKLLSKIDNKFIIVAAKVHLVVTVNSEIYHFDQVIDSEKQYIPKIINIIKDAMTDISKKVGEVSVDNIDFSTDIFIKNDNKKFVWIESNYSKKATGFSNTSGKTLPLDSHELKEHVTDCKQAFQKENFPIIDNNNDFISECI